MRAHLTGRLALAGLALLLAACSAAPAPTPVASIPTIVVPTATPTPPEATFQVQRGEVVDLLQLRGRVAAAIDQDVFFTEQGFIKQLLVQREQFVATGELLAELDLGELPDQLERARSDLRTLERQTASSRQQRSYSVQLARLTLQNAQGRLDQLMAPTDPAKIVIAQREIERARIALEQTRDAASAAKTNAKLAVERAANEVRNRQDEYSRVTWANGNKPLDQLTGEQRIAQEQAARAIEDARALLQQAEIAYDLAVLNERNVILLAERDLADAEDAMVALQAPPDPFALSEAQRAVQQAQVSLNQTLANSVGPEMASRIELAKQTIAEIEKKIEASKLYAPFDGIVAEIGVKPGDIVEAYAPIMNIVDPSELTLVVTEISSADLARMAPGQRLEVTFDRYPDQTVAGRVEQLPSDETAAGSLVRGNRLLRIDFDNLGATLQIGDPAQISLVFQRKPDALWLPPQAIYRFDQRTFVLLLEQDQQRPVDITTGISAVDRVEILSGLNEGDVVVLSDVVTR